LTADRRLEDADRALAAGDTATAIDLATRIVDDRASSPAQRALALRLRSDAHAADGAPARSLDDAQAAVALAPTDARAFNALGIAAADAGEGARALAAFARATELDPGYARAWNNLGNALRAAGRGGEARRAYERAIAADPRYALAHVHLAILHRDAGDDAAARDGAQRALALDPAQRTARLLLAGVDRRAGRLDAAIAGYERALAQREDDAPVRLALAGTLAERDDLEPARAAYVRAAKDAPGLLRARLGAVLALPMIAGSAAAIAEARARYADGLARLRDELPAAARAMTHAEVLDELRWTNFLLAYQGEDDRALQQAYGDVVAATLDAARGPRAGAGADRTAGDGRRRVAFVSAFFRDGTVGRYFEHWITGLDRARFHVALHHVAAGEDALTARLRARADAFVAHGAAPASQAAAAIAALAPDVVVYPELGMDATTFALAALRLAPMQVAGWGHPVTSGLATIDRMATAGEMEPPDGERQYRESLLRLPGLGTRYARPAPPPPVARAALGLPDDGPLVLFPQSLFKLHPDDDLRIARLLAAAPRARLVAFEGRHPRLTQRWRARLDPVLDAHGVAPARVLALRQADHATYLRINLACDLMLDSARWSGGNTSLDAIACALPIVTLPGRTMRARQSAAMLARVGAGALVAADEDACIALAASLLADRDERSRASRAIAEGASMLFDDRAPIDAFARALDAA